MSILIVEDDQIIIMLIERILRSQYQTITATSGVEALKLLRTQPGIELIVADIMMPEMNGLELLRIIKDSVFFKDTPVIFCTTAMDRDKVRLAAELGCFYYLLKPVQRNLLLQRVSQALSKANPSIWPMETTLARHGFDQAAYIKRAQAFNGVLQAELQCLQQTTTAAASTFASRFHELAAGAETFGAKHLLDRIEAMRQTSMTPAEFQLNFQRLLWEMQRVSELLRAQLHYCTTQTAA